MATIRDVAAMAGVSPATVSRVLNGSHPVKEETRLAVEQAIRKLNFTPNLVGRNLSIREKRTILLIAPTVISERYSMSLLGISRAAADAGYDLLISVYVEDAARPERNNWARCEQYIASGLADGVILLSSRVIDAAMQSGRISLPVVQCCESGIGGFPNSISCDNRKALFDLTELLIAQGRRRFAFVCTKKEYEDAPSDFSRDRLNGMRHALEKHGLPYDPSLTICCTQLQGEDSIRQYEGEKAAIRYFAELPLDQRPDAILCSYDSIAFACVDVLQRSGIRVPQDIAVAGFDDSSIVRLSTPHLTSVQVPSFEMGAESVRLLISLIRGERRSGCQILLAQQVMERGSTNENFE